MNSSMFPAARSTVARALAFAAVLAALIMPQVAFGTATWAQTFGVDATEAAPYDGQDYPLSVAAMPDGGVVVIGKLSSPANADTHQINYDAIVRYSSTGAIVWKKSIRGTDGFDAEGFSHHEGRVLTDAAGNIFIISQLNLSSVNSSAYPYVARLDPSGNIIWQTNLKIPSEKDPYTGFTTYLNGPFLSAYLSSTGKIVTSGSYYSGPGSQPFVAVFDATTGAVELLKGYGYPEGGVQYQGGWAVCSSWAGDRYVFVTEAGAGDPTSSVVMVSTAGAIVAEKKITTNDGIPIGILPTADNGYVMLSTNGIRQGLWIRKFASDLTIVTERYMPYFAGSSLTPTADGGFVVGSSGDINNARNGQLFHNNESRGPKAFLLKFSSALSLERVSVYGGAYEEGQISFGPSIVVATQTTDGGYALSTSSASYGPINDSVRPDWWTIKVDQYGRMQNFKDRMADVTAYYSIGAPPAFVEPRVASHSLLPSLLREERLSPDLLFSEATAVVRTQADVSSLPDVAPTQAFSVSSSGYQIHNSWQFTAYLGSAASGRTVSVQYANAPVIEGRWTDVPGGGQMTLVDPAAGLWQLKTTQPIPDSSSLQYISFRAISAAPGFADTVSEFSQIFQINASVASQPPVVAITSPTNGATFNFEQGFTVSANVTTSVHISSVQLRIGPFVSRGASPSFAVPAGALAPGDYDATVTATNDIGDVTTSTPIRITVRPRAGTIFNFTGAAAGDWNTPTNWTPAGIPGPADTARLSNGAIASIEGKEVSVGSLTIDNGGVTGNGKLTVTKAGNWAAGSFADIHLVIAQDAVIALDRDEQRFVRTEIDNYGTILVTGGFVTGDGDSLLLNYGLFTFDYFTNIVLVSFRFGEIHNFGVFSLAGLTVATEHGFLQSNGELSFGELSGGLIGDLSVDGGSVTGSGSILGDLMQLEGYLSPGNSPGRITVTGNYTMGAGATLVLEVAGTDGAAKQFDHLQVLRTATLNGKLIVRTIKDFTPAATDVFNLISCGSESGNFANVTANAKVSLGSNGVAVSIDPASTNPTKGQPLNIATRLKVEAGDNVLIAGFIVTGPSGSTKKVLIRALGPSLGKFGVAGAIADPLLELHQSDGTVVTNDNWPEGDPSQIPDGFAPLDPRESVISATLPPGSYSAIVKGAHGETGVAIAEVYDLDHGTVAQLGNIATRGFVQGGDNVMIGGFIVGGAEPAKILVRAIGPALTQFGVAGALADPTLELHDGNGSSISNDDWRAYQETEIIATTIPPTNDREPAILVTLPPGPYTAIVRGKGDTTGVALVEAYNLK